MKNAILYYKDFRLSKLTSEKYKHLLWLIFWPLYGLMFYFVENIFAPEEWNVMECTLDEMIPFCEWFYIPYIFWFVFVFGSLIYTLLFDVKAFNTLMRFIAITYTTAILIFLIYPSCQMLRPSVMPEQNILTDLVSQFYSHDTNTNVFPSVHVIGSIAVPYGLWNARHLNKWFIRLPLAITAALISISTVFMKQHSFLDVVCAVVVCLSAYLLISLFTKPVVNTNRKVAKNRYIEY